MLKYLSVLKIDARQQLAYRGEFLMRGTMIAMFMLIFVALWNSVYAIQGAGEMAGFRLSQVIWYLAMTETVILSGSRIFVEISEAVKSGDLAYTLVRPYSYVGFQIAHSLGLSLPRLALNFGVATLVILPLVRCIETTWAGLAGFLVLALAGLLLDAMIAVLIGLGAFFIEDVLPIYWIYSKLLMSIGGMFLPLEMFPAWLRQISAVLPFQFIIYAPARTFVDFDLAFFLRALAGQGIYIVVVAVILSLVWRWGRRRVTVHGG
ncbi:MAG: ABC-2 family transporter protein [Anaerolineae bacterium]|nr:ABC-2 family transporter protein [Anaerolineae bacterium]